MSGTVQSWAPGGTLHWQDRDEASGCARGMFTLSDFRFECGAVLPSVHIYFETWGTLAPDGCNAVVVCHALTGDAHVASGYGRDGWWSGLVGPGKAIDTRRWFVIASNVLGGCTGSSGPASLAPDGQPYALRFPPVTIRDMVRAQVALVQALGVRTVALVTGGSLGGMQVWEWPLLAPGLVQRAAVIAAHAAFPPLGIGYNEAMRLAIMADADWQGGNYYGTGRAPRAGLAAARAIGMLTYRTDLLFDERFGRRLVTAEVAQAAGAAGWEVQPDPAEWLSGREPLYEVEAYLRHHGEKLNARFDANSYLYLTRAMDVHDIGRGRGGLESALAKLACDVTVIGIDTDYLYAARDLRRTAALARECGVRCRYREIVSKYGHDAFLIEFDQLSRILADVWAAR